MRRVKRGADGVVSPAKRFAELTTPAPFIEASPYRARPSGRHPSFSRRGKNKLHLISNFSISMRVVPMLRSPRVTPGSCQ